ncbi:hypothetical protein niasHS_004354 [Heterodera schachtii]|uniref:Uncharacterized protein n=1 Tax=Heterodera schachtii TaxID=97005 RepID=A0ABD2K0P3_HETSC
MGSAKKSAEDADTTQALVIPPGMSQLSEQRLSVGRTVSTKWAKEGKRAQKGQQTSNEQEEKEVQRMDLLINGHVKGQNGVLDHYSQFKDFAKTKRDRLEEARQFQYFKRDADELEIWILEKLQTAAEESFRDPTNLQAKIQKHDAFVAEVPEVQAHSNAITKLDKTGNDMIQHDHYEKETIRKRLDRLHELWDRLFAMLENKGIKLQQTLKLLQFVRKCDEMLYWIKNKIQFVSTDDLDADLEHVEVMQRKFDEFLKELKSHESRVLDINHEANALIDEGYPEQQQIHGKRDEVNEAWHKLGTLTSTRGEALFGAKQIQRFYRDIDETLVWMGKKELTLATDDFGRDLNNVQALQRKHEDTERDLAALESKMDELGTETNRLCQLYPEKSEDIAAKVDEARGRWEALKLSAEQRKRGLDRSYNRHRFMADYRELVEWTKGIQALIQSSELAKDVAGAEALLEQHQEHKGEIEARTDSFKQTAETGQRLLDEDIEEADEIRQCLQNLAMEQTSLNNLWEERRILYEQCMDLQLFYRDTEQAESWMTKQELLARRRHLMDPMAQRRE